MARIGIGIGIGKGRQGSLLKLVPKEFTAIQNITLASNLQYLGYFSGYHYANLSGINQLQRSSDLTKWTALKDSTDGNVIALTRTSNGNLIAGTVGTATRGIFVSTDDGLTWVKKIQHTTSNIHAGISEFQGFSIHESTIVISEYDSGNYGSRTGAKVWMSKDEGVTWKLVFDLHKTVPVEQIGQSHIHGAFYDPYWDRVWVCCGDSPASTGIWYSDNYWNRTGDETDTFNDYQYIHSESNSANAMPQPIAGYALKDRIIFGTDAAKNGIYAISRPSIKTDPLLFVRVYEFGGNDGMIYCIPQLPKKLSSDEPLLIQYKPNDQAVDKINKIIASYNGKDWRIVYSDNVEYYTRGLRYYKGDNCLWINTLGNQTGINSLLRCVRFDGLPPTGLTATSINDTEIDLAWTNQSQNNDGSKVYISSDNITFTLLETLGRSVNTYGTIGLKPYTQYYFKVTSYKGLEESLPVIANTVTLGPEIFNDGNTFGWYDYNINVIKDTSNKVSAWNSKVGDKHLLQATSQAQPLYSASGIKFDGVANFLKSASFAALPQPFTYYLVIKQKWVDGKHIMDGATSDSVIIRQRIGSNTIRCFAGVVLDAINTPDETYFILRVLWNGANSKIVINGESPVNGNLGTGSLSGITIARQGLTAANFAEIELKELIIRKVADDSTNEAAIYNYLKTKYGM